MREFGRLTHDIDVVVTSSTTGCLYDNCGATVTTKLASLMTVFPRDWPDRQIVSLSLRKFSWPNAPLPGAAHNARVRPSDAWYQRCRHWWHRRLSLWQHAVSLWSQSWHHLWHKQRVLMHGHQGWNVRHGLCHIPGCHIYMRYVYIYIYELFIAFVSFVVCSLL